MKFKSRSYEQATTILDIRNLSVKLPNQPDIEPILDGISLKIRAGETACLVGESGSGKSVTSLAVMGLLPKGALQVTGGEISLQDRELLGLSNNELRHLRASSMAMIFQEPMTALNPVMKVGDQIEEVLKIHANMSASERKARVLDIMEQVHLPDVRRIHGSYPHQLSGGQRQRIMIAMALVLKPQLLIADEPTTALDVTTQEQILSLISELQEVQGTAVLFVTHDMGVVAEIADTVHVMKEGQIVEQAPVEQLLRQPRNDYTRKLLQAVPSLIPRKIVRRNQMTRSCRSGT
ncbi:ABC transporter ATP-binding protein [Fodinicurvata halophila]|uniref:ABC transporter ATP-binding protein n=1 Tax=Fodinicurvata halophila TaxID=1419723 RepID=UPI0036304E7C